MPSVVDRDEVQRLMAEENALLVEVLPKHEFDDEHIAGAISLPIKELNARTTAHFDKDRPIIVYCWDMQ